MITYVPMALKGSIIDIYLLDNKSIYLSIPNICKILELNSSTQTRKMLKKIVKVPVTSSVRVNSLNVDHIEEWMNSIKLNKIPQTGKVNKILYYRDNLPRLVKEKVQHLIEDTSKVNSLDILNEINNKQNKILSILKNNNKEKKKKKNIKKENRHRLEVKDYKKEVKKKEETIPLNEKKKMEKYKKNIQLRAKIYKELSSFDAEERKSYYNYLYKAVETETGINLKRMAKEESDKINEYVRPIQIAEQEDLLEVLWKHLEEILDQS